jgi:DNA-binding FadR family transcriptional regulator
VISARGKEGARLERRRLVQTTAAKLRDIILAREPHAQIGSLGEVASLLGVGIVTVQQAARVLEHEGLLAVRRGPGGGYYGARPDEAALERSVAAYMRVHGCSYADALDITSLLDCEIIASAARCRDESLRSALQALGERIAGCDTEQARIAFEEEFHDLLLKMDARPLYELLMRVAMQLYRTPPAPRPLFPGKEGVAVWKASKRQIIGAILERDADLARFEAERHRRQLMRRLRRTGTAKSGSP